MSVLGNRLYQAYKDQNHCDIELQLQDGIIKAHKIVLALGSQWFEARLGDNWNKQVGAIKCDTHSGESTRALIEFLYTSKIEISIDNAEELFQVADYYNVEDLIKKCTDFLEKNMTINTVFQILNISHKNNIHELKSKCLHFLDLHIESILSSQIADFSFCEMSLEILLEIIQRDSMCIHEELLFKAISSWTTQVDEGELPNTWKHITPHVRFGRMSTDFFLSNVVKKSIIDDALSLRVMVHLSTVEEGLDTQHARERAAMTKNDVLVHRFPHHSEDCTWEIDESLDGDRISFTVNKDIKLRGVLLFGKSEANIIFGIKVYSDTGNTLTLCSKTDVKQKCQTPSSVPVILPTPLSLKTDTVYTVAMKATGGPTAYGKAGLSMVSLALGRDEVLCVKFFDSGCGNTNVQTGQIEGLIFHHVQNM
jgi:hypothetical protein